MRNLALACAFISSIAVAEPAQFDELVQQIESGQRYFSSAEDYRSTLALLEQYLPPDDEARLQRLDRLRCMLAYYVDPLQGIVYSDEKIISAKQRQDFTALADYYLCRYYLYSRLGDTALAEQNATLSFDAAKQSEQPLAIAVSRALLGDIASYRGKYADAMQHYLMAYQLQRGIGYKPYISDLILSIAATYRRMGLYQDALLYIEQAQQEFSAKEEPFRHALIMHEKAYSYAETGQYEKALHNFEQSMAVYQQMNEPLWQAYTKVNLVWINNLLKRYDTALKLAAEAKKELTAQQADDQSALMSYQGLLALYHAETLIAQNKFSAALNSLAEAEQKLTAENNPRYMLLFYNAKAAALAGDSKFEAAYNHLRQYVSLNQQQSSLSREQHSNVLRFQFDSSRQQENTERLTAEKQMAETHVNTLQVAQRWQYAALSLIALLFVILFSFALSLKRRNKRLHRLAMTDELTGIANRRRIMMQAEQERIKALDTQQPLSFLILDLDHFKQVNDRHGHDIGDHVLQQMAMAVTALLREQDHFGRTGGEEFLIVLPDTAEQEALAIAERLRQAVAAIRINSARELRITCSIGITQYQLSEALNLSLARADNALYSAKASGRNKVLAKT